MIKIYHSTDNYETFGQYKQLRQNGRRMIPFDVNALVLLATSLGGLQKVDENIGC